MNIHKYLKNAGYDTVGRSFYNMIAVWKSWYVSNVLGFHRYKVYNGARHVKKTRYSIGMAKTVCEDMADLLMNERVEIHSSDELTDEYLQKVLQNNNFAVMMNDFQERKSYEGTVAYVPYLNNVVVANDGSVLGNGGSVAINYIDGDNVYPLSWSNGDVLECCFVSYHMCNGSEYALIQLHILESGEYVIENHVVKTNNNAGVEVPYERWKDLKPFAGMQKWIHTGTDKRQFVIDRLNISNNVDKDSPMGIAIFANAIDQLKGLDVVYDSYVNEFVLGKKRVFVAPEMLREGIDGPSFDPNDVTFYMLPEDDWKGNSPLIESNMALRSEEHNKALNDILNMLSIKCGFGTKHYKFEQGNITTATQVISENSDMFRTLKKHEIILESAMKELCDIVIRLLSVIGTPVKLDSEISVCFDDSIIEDTESERAQDRLDVSMGAMTVLEYRMKWYHETEEEAEKNIVTETFEPDFNEE